MSPGKPRIEAKQTALWSLCVALTIAPLAWLLFLMRQYCVDVPFWDQWDFVPLLQKSYVGHITFSDLWAQHNEHRLIFPRIVMLLLAHATHWNTLYEQATNVVLAALIFVVLAFQARNTVRLAGARGLIWILPIVSFMVFSVSQAENWCAGWQLQVFMNVLATVAGLVLLAGSGESRLRFAGAIALGVVSAYSFANGIIYWPAGLVVLLLIGPSGKRRVLNMRVALWLVAALVTTASYLYHFKHPSGHPPLSFIFKHFGAWVLYVMTYLGAPCGMFAVPIARVTGTLGLGIFCYSAWALLRSKRLGMSDLAPYIGITLYAIGSAMVSGVGRAGFGQGQALSSRYVTMSNLLWVSDFVLLYCLLIRPSSGFVGDGTSRARVPSVRRMRAVFIPLTSVILILSALSSLMQISYAVRKTASLRDARDELLLGGNYSDAMHHYRVFGILYPQPRIVEERYPFLEEYHLSVFRD